MHWDAARIHLCLTMGQQDVWAHWRQTRSLEVVSRREREGWVVSIAECLGKLQ